MGRTPGRYVVQHAPRFQHRPLLHAQHRPRGVAKPKVRSRTSVHPFGRRGSEEPRFPPDCCFEFLAGESLDHETLHPFLHPKPAEAGTLVERVPGGSALPERPPTETTEPSLPTAGTSMPLTKRSTSGADARPHPVHFAVAREMPQILERTPSEAIDPKGSCPSADYPPDPMRPHGYHLIRRSAFIYRFGPS